MAQLDPFRSGDPAAPAAPVLTSARLGEELPVFCEKCGYSLHGLPPNRCPACQVLHFQCPECGHHQPINTLRPAAQRILGRLRAWALGLSIFFRINFFFWLLFAWAAGGYELSFQYRSYTNPAYSPYAGGRQYITRMDPAPIDREMLLGLGLLGLLFGLVSRMWLLRWPRGYLVGPILGAAVMVAMFAGAVWRAVERDVGQFPISGNLLAMAMITASSVALGALVAWPVWWAMVHLFLPRRVAHALLEWQTSLSSDGALARQ